MKTVTQLTKVPRATGHTRLRQENYQIHTLVLVFKARLDSQQHSHFSVGSVYRNESVQQFSVSSV